MKKAMAVIGVIIVVLVIVAWIAYNGIIGKDEACKTAWGQVETVLQRRFDLIPGLVETVKGYAKHESGVFEEVAKLRSQWGEAKSQDDRSRAGGLLEGALGRLIAVAENYPELKANQSFISLQDELANTENKISVERQRYNDSVKVYNVAIRKFPGMIWARMFGFETRNQFEAGQGAEKAPAVKF